MLWPYECLNEILLKAPLGKRPRGRGNNVRLSSQVEVAHVGQLNVFLPAATAFSLESVGRALITSRRDHAKRRHLDLVIFDFALALIHADIASRSTRGGGGGGVDVNGPFDCD